MTHQEHLEEVLRNCTAEIEKRTGFHVKNEAIAEHVTFEQWCEALADEGLKVEGKRFSLEERPALRHLYAMVPQTREEARKWVGVVMKGAQTGATVWEMLAMLYVALKFEPVAIGMYLPSQPLATHNSTHRLLPIIRTIPVAYKRLTGGMEAGPRGGSKEGSVLTRHLRDSMILMLWSSGTVTTESYPLDVLVLDEVQEIAVADVEKIRERLSGSDLGMQLLASTANWPEADIDHFYRGGTRERFHTRCKCPTGVILDEVFPDCIVYNDGKQGFRTAPRDYVYRCPKCKTWIPDPQEPAKIKGSPDGWVAESPEAPYRSVHLPQTLSSTVSAREIITAFHEAQDLKNFYNRKLGKPWANPDQIPITDEVLAACVADGKALSSAWLEGASNTYMGIDQMGQFNVVTIKRQGADGRREIVHLELIFNESPFQRCSKLMGEYGVSVCVVECNPNYNDAKRFAYRHKGRVWLANYADMKDDMIRWGDVHQTRADRKTRVEERDRYTVTLDQYKCMSVSLGYFTNRQTLIPPPGELVQEVRDKGQRRNSAVCREYFFLHLKRVALVTIADEKTHKSRARVEKVGIDPHFAFANMLCDVAFARAHGTAGFILPPTAREAEQEKLDKAVRKRAVGMPSEIVSMIGKSETPLNSTCGQCANFDPERKFCTLRNFRVQAKDPECDFFVPKSR